MSSLTELQKQTIETIYSSLKTQIDTIIDHFKKNNSTQVLFYTFLISQIVKKVEQTTLKGVDKKNVAIEIGRLIMKDIITEPTEQEQILIIYDTLASSLIDQLIDVASNLNIKAENVQVSQPKACCNIM